jgi:hypothetical protein
MALQGSRNKAGKLYAKAEKEVKKNANTEKEAEEA